MAEHADNQIILVVDDTPENIHVLGSILRDSYDVRAALNGERALKIARSNPKPDMILLDIMMPDMDGYEVYRRLKADPATSDIPVIFVTAKDEAKDRRFNRTTASMAVTIPSEERCEQAHGKLVGVELGGVTREPCCREGVAGSSVLSASVVLGVSSVVCGQGP